MIADREVTFGIYTEYAPDRHEQPCDAVAITESCGHVIMWVLRREEFDETYEELLARAARIAEWLTNHGTKQGRRD